MRRSRASRDKQHSYDLCEASIPCVLSPLVFPSQSQPTWEKLNYKVFGFCLKANRDSWKGCVPQRDRASLGVWNNPLGTQEKWLRLERLRPGGQGGAWSGGWERMTCLS